MDQDPIRLEDLYRPSRDAVRIGPYLMWLVRGITWYGAPIGRTLAVKGPYDDELRQTLKKLGGKWSREAKVWLVPFSKEREVKDALSRATKKMRARPWTERQRNFVIKLFSEILPDAFATGSPLQYDPVIARLKKFNADTNDETAPSFKLAQDIKEFIEKTSIKFDLDIFEFPCKAAYLKSKIQEAKDMFRRSREIPWAADMFRGLAGFFRNKHNALRKMKERWEESLRNPKNSMHHRSVIFYAEYLRGKDCEHASDVAFTKEHEEYLEDLRYLIDLGKIPPEVAEMDIPRYVPLRIPAEEYRWENGRLVGYGHARRRRGVYYRSRRYPS